MYRTRPKLKTDTNLNIYKGYKEIFDHLEKNIYKDHIIASEAYPSLDTTKFIEPLQQRFPELTLINTEDYFVSPERIYSTISEDLTEDKVFGRFSHRTFIEFFDPIKLVEMQQKIQESNSPVLVIGVAASQIVDYDTLIYLDINRWDIQKHYKRGGPNWQAYKETEFDEKLKRAYYFEWPAATEIKDQILATSDYYIDMNDVDEPKMITGEQLVSLVEDLSKKPIRMVPFFEPGIWGGHWMQETFDVGTDEINLAWCFDGVVEENSILIEAQERTIEMPAQNLILLNPIEILGYKVFGRYGKDFPIRFNLLDTMGGQNLSLQVHPTLDYAYRNFGAKYTQDESYYVLDTKGDAVVYLGVKDDVSREELVDAFEKSKETGTFNHNQYINSYPVKKHDHFLIPGGTIHSSGEDSIVLEISSTPNRFTFKLWDWGRLDLDGKPRPISLHHGKHVINTSINDTFVKNNLYNNITKIEEEKNYLIEKTGLHESEAIETNRIIFTDRLKSNTNQSVNVLNLVDGKNIQVVSVDDSFAAFDVYYGETFIIPENIGEYYLEPVNTGEKCVVIRAHIR